MHPGHQLSKSERLRHISGRTEFQAEDHVELRVDGADHQDRNRRDGPDTAAYIDAVHPGEQHVEQDDVGNLLVEEAESLVAISRQDDVEPLDGEARGQRLTVGVLVLDHQDSGALAFHDHRQLLPAAP